MYSIFTIPFCQKHLTFCKILRLQFCAHKRIKFVLSEMLCVCVFVCDCTRVIHKKRHRHNNFRLTHRTKHRRCDHTNNATAYNIIIRQNTARNRNDFFLFLFFFLFIFQFVSSLCHAVAAAAVVGLCVDLSFHC